MKRNDVDNDRLVDSLHLFSQQEKDALLQSWIYIIEIKYAQWLVQGAMSQ